MLIEDHLKLRLVRLKPPQDWKHPPEGLAFVFAKGGSGNYSSASGSHHLSPGDMLMLHGEAQGKLSSANASEVAFWTFSLNLEHLFPLFSGNEIPLLQSLADELKAPRIFRASSPLAMRCQRLVAEAPPQLTLDHRVHLLRIASAVLTEEFNAANHQRAGFVRIEDHLVQVFEKLSIDELINLSVSELAGKFGCSRRHLNRLFHHYFGLSVAALRMEMRLLKAISLLRDPTAKIISVAERCGFNHLGLFNTCFKRRFGTSPGQWRKAAFPQKSRSQSMFPHSDGSTCPLQANGLCRWVNQPPSGSKQSKPQSPPLAGPPHAATAFKSPGQDILADIVALHIGSAPADLTPKQASAG